MFSDLFGFEEQFAMDPIIGEEPVPSEGTVEFEGWGLIASHPHQREYAIVTGPWDGQTPDDYPTNIVSLGDLLKQAIDQLGHLSQGHWAWPRHFRVTVEEVKGFDVSTLVQCEGSETAVLDNPRYRQHLKNQEQLALEDFRAGEITMRQAKAASRAAQDARLVDVLALVKEQVDTMQLRYMGRYTSYFIDKYEVLRLIDQLVEDIMNGRTNIERVLRYELGSHPPEDLRTQRWFQGGTAEAGEETQKGRRTPPHR